MKKFLKIIYIFGLFVFCANFYASALTSPPSISSPSKIFTKDMNKVISQTISASTNPIRDGANDIAKNLSLADKNGAKIDNFTSALDTVGGTIKKIVDYLLGFLAFISLVYLLYYGFILLFGSLDDGATKKAYAAVRNAARAIVGIGISWLIVEAAFRIVGWLTK